MFADEARFGRINCPRPCWAPIGIRPEVASQLIREYVYLYGAVSPKDGKRPTSHVLAGRCRAWEVCSVIGKLVRLASTHDDSNGIGRTRTPATVDEY
jgi:hypothetical protein